MDLEKLLPLFISIYDAINVYSIVAKHWHAKEVPFMDMTGLQTFAEIISQFNKRGVNVYLCEANTHVSGKLKKIGILSSIKEGRIFATLTEAIQNLPV